MNTEEERNLSHEFHEWTRVGMELNALFIRVHSCNSWPKLLLFVLICVHRCSSVVPLLLLQRLNLHRQHRREVSRDRGPVVSSVGRAVHLAARGAEVDAALLD